MKRSTGLVPPYQLVSRVSRAGVLAAYRDGVTVICELAAQFTDAMWLAVTPCSEWRAVDLAGHLLLASERDPGWVQL